MTALTGCRSAEAISFVSSGFTTSQGLPDLDRCEDAPPLWLPLDDDSTLIAVADGLGGYSAGFDNHTGSFWAARFAIEGVREVASRDDVRRGAPEKFASHLLEELKRRLSGVATKLPVSRLKGDLGAHRLATTLAAAIARRGASGTEIRLFWIGDSRLYWLSETALHQLSKDDVKSPSDALDALVNDSPMSQFLSANMAQHWNIHCADITLPARGLLLACTDGCFAYWNAPWELEIALRRAFDECEHWPSWLTTVQRSIDNVKRDDASLAVFPLCPGSYHDVRALLGSAEKELLCCRAAESGDSREARRVAWQTVYGPAYEKYSWPKPVDVPQRAPEPPASPMATQGASASRRESREVRAPAEPISSPDSDPEGANVIKAAATPGEPPDPVQHRAQPLDEGTVAPPSTRVRADDRRSPSLVHQMLSPPGCLMLLCGILIGSMVRIGWNFTTEPENHEQRSGVQPPPVDPIRGSTTSRSPATGHEERGALSAPPAPVAPGTASVASAAVASSSVPTSALLPAMNATGIIVRVNRNASVLATPENNGALLLQLPVSSAVETFESTNGFIRVRAKGVDGWVKSEFVKVLKVY